MAKKNEVAPLKSLDAVLILKRVWGGENVSDACDKNHSVRRMFYKWCEVNSVPPPKKGELIKKYENEKKKSRKRISKKMLDNEKLSQEIRKGILTFASMDSSWAKTGISFLESDAKGKSGTVTAEEYGDFIENLFKPHVITCSECGALNDAKKTRKRTSDQKKSRKNNTAP